MQGRTFIIQTQGTLESKEKIEQLLKAFPSILKSQALNEPVIIERKGEPSGYTGFIVTNANNITIDTFSLAKKIEVHIYSFFRDLGNESIHFLSRELQIPLDLFKTQLISDRSGRIECQEPNCTDKANMSWNGLHVCQDHYEQHKAKSDSDIFDMNKY